MVRHHKVMVHPTLRLHVDPLHPQRYAQVVEQAAAILRAGGTVAFATETVYGLGANALDSNAVEKIFIAKQRPAWDPLIVHIATTAMLSEIVSDVPEPAHLWMEHFWPGPLTLLLPRSTAIPDAVTAGRARVGIRIPRHPVAQALLRAAAIPVAAPSANLFGHVSPTTAAHVLADLDGRIDAVLDGGPAEHGLESTVVDACEDPCLIYRPGAVTLEQLAEVWPRVELYRGTPIQGELIPLTNASPLEAKQPQALPSPGFGLRHYAPRARLILIEQGPSQAEALLHALLELRTTLDNVAGTAGVMLPENFLSPEQSARLPQAVERYVWGSWSKLEELAQRLFAGLRALDAASVATIICPLPASHGIGAALCDRLRKAARPR